MVEIKNYNSNSTEYNLSVQLLKELTLSSSIEIQHREVLFIEDICKRVTKSKSVLYVLRDVNSIIGIVAVSVTSIKEQPSLQIDYILVSDQYRGKELEILDNCKPFRYLIEFVIDLAKKYTTENRIEIYCIVS